MALGGRLVPLIGGPTVLIGSWLTTRTRLDRRSISTPTVRAGTRLRACLIERTIVYRPLIGTPTILTWTAIAGRPGGRSRCEAAVELPLIVGARTVIRARPDGTAVDVTLVRELTLVGGAAILTTATIGTRWIDGTRVGRTAVNLPLISDPALGTRLIGRLTTIDDTIIQAHSLISTRLIGRLTTIDDTLVRADSLISTRLIGGLATVGGPPVWARWMGGACGVGGLPPVSGRTVRARSLIRARRIGGSAVVGDSGVRPLVARPTFGRISLIFLWVISGVSTVCDATIRCPIVLGLLVGAALVRGLPRGPGATGLWRSRSRGLAGNLAERGARPRPDLISGKTPETGQRPRRRGLAGLGPVWSPRRLRLPAWGEPLRGPRTRCLLGTLGLLVHLRRTWLSMDGPGIDLLGGLTVAGPRLRILGRLGGGTLARTRRRGRAGDRVSPDDLGSV